MQPTFSLVRYAVWCNINKFCLKQDSLPKPFHYKYFTDVILITSGVFFFFFFFFFLKHNDCAIAFSPFYFIFNYFLSGICNVDPLLCNCISQGALKSEIFNPHVSDGTESHLAETRTLYCSCTLVYSNESISMLCSRWSILISISFPAVTHTQR